MPSVASSPFAGADSAIALEGGAQRVRAAVTPFILAAAVVYVVGCIMVTAGFHVPRNDALARLDPTAASSLSDWRSYLTAWTAGNHVRAAAGIVAATLYLVALLPNGDLHPSRTA